MTKSKIVPVILSGGSGTRLWPLSRALYPKQFLPLASNLTMMQETAQRVVGDEFLAPMVICNNYHRFLVAGQLQEIGIEPQSIILEPMGRNTAPAACIAAMIIAKNHPGAVMMILASDHVIAREDQLRSAAATARDAVLSGALVTFGIEPDSPHTGYGYIKRGLSDTTPGCFKVDQFVEKPDAETAKGYLAEGGYYWNSGMFMFAPDQYLAELEQNNAAMVEACRAALDGAERDLDFIRLDAGAFAKSPSDSIDYAVMENTRRASVLPVDLGWNDVGGWPALWDIGDKDSDGNILLGDVIAKGVKNSYIRSESHLVGVLGVENLVVIAMDDAVMVADKNNIADVKVLVDDLKAKNRTEHHSHTTVYRPWGWYKIIGAGDRYLAKMICLHPQSSISLQLHNHRSEHWVVVEGTARVTCGDAVSDLDVDQSMYIAVGTKHRLENPFDVPLKIIEVQTGAYLAEDDIVRFEDNYGRI
jgi:mannose-1-phosphate guanylyltransferase/mannose-6-phosphate isomerase